MWEMGAPEEPEQEKVWKRLSSDSEESGKEPEVDGMEGVEEVDATLK